MDVSVIVPTCNRPQYLNRTLSSLVTQKCSAKFEVLVLDDYGKDDRARQIVEFWGRRCEVRYLDPVVFGMRRGRTRIRNLGIAQARGRVVIFLDDDMIVPPDFIEEHLKSHEGAENRVVLGYRYYVKLSYQFLEYVNPVNIIADPVILENLPTVRDEREAVYRMCHGDLTRLPAPWVLLYSNNCSVKKELLEKVGGGFNELFMGAWGGEDVELGYRLYKGGAHYVLNRRAVGYHQWHYVDWRKNVASLKVNLLKFFQTHPELDTELYTDYVEVGLNQYLLDLDHYSGGAFAWPRSVWETDRAWRAFGDRFSLQPGTPTLLIGQSDGQLAKRLNPSVISDPLATPSKSGGTEPIRHKLLGAHLPYEDNRFGTVVVNDGLEALPFYHRKLVFREALRLTSGRVLFGTRLATARALLGVSASTPNSVVLERAVGEIFGVHSEAPASVKAEVNGTMVLFTLLKKHVPVRKQLCGDKRLIIVADSGMADAFCDNAVELTLALRRKGCDVSLQFEDYKTLELVALNRLPFWNRYSPEERRSLEKAMHRDLRGEKHLFPQLSLTGQSHYFDCRIDWLRSNTIGVLSSPYVHALNDQVDSVWCPSEAFRRCYVRSGGKPEKAVHLPVGVSSALIAKRKAPAPMRSRYRFVCIGSVEKSDGIDAALTAFCVAFRKLKKAQLVVRILPIKSRESIGRITHHNRTAQREHTKHVEQAQALYRFRLEKWRAMVRRHKIEPDRVRFETIKEELRGWPDHFSDADCYVQAHRVDPVGQRVLQAMSLGLPVITTGRYLPAALTGIGINYLVRSREVTAAEGEWSSEVVYARWAEPSVAHLARILKHVFLNRIEAKRRGERAREIVRAAHTWDHVADLVMEDLRRLSAGPTTPPPSAPLSELFSHLKENGLINIEEEAYERR